MTKTKLLQVYRGFPIGDICFFRDPVLAQQVIDSGKARLWTVEQDAPMEGDKVHFIQKSEVSEEPK